MDIICPSCGLKRDADEMLPAAALLEGISEEIKKDHPRWSGEENVCKWCVAQGKAGWLQRALETEIGVLTAEELLVIQSIRERKLVSGNMNEAPELEQEASARFAERITASVGSWRFSGAILLFLGLWVGLNLLLRPFEPYPVVIFAVISAVLASLAALQGPVILMNQRHQQMKARLEAENDYRVNLKAELEVRYLQEAIELVLSKLGEVQR